MPRGKIQKTALDHEMRDDADDNRTAAQAQYQDDYTNVNVISLQDLPAPKPGKYIHTFS